MLAVTLRLMRSTFVSFLVFPCLQIAVEAAFAKHFPDIVFIENAVAVRELCGSFAVAVIEIPRQGSQKCHKILKAE